MESIKIVARYINGGLAKGYTQDFFPNKPIFHLYPYDTEVTEKVEIQLKDLKAVFFVKDFAGDPTYKERKRFLANEKPSGRVIEVTFKDGEKIVGSTLGYDSQRSGFFIFPADPQENNMRVFAVSKSVTNVRFL